MSDADDTPDTTRDEDPVDTTDEAEETTAEEQAVEGDTEEKSVTPPKPKNRLKRVLIGLTVLVALGFLTILVLPIGLRLGAEYWLRSQGQSNADIGDIDFNPFTGRIVIKTLDTTGTAGDELTMSEAEIKIRWSDLLDKRIYIEKFSLSDVVLDVVVTEDGTLIIGGLPIPASEAPAESDSEPWGIGLGGIELANVTIRYSDPVLQEELLVETISFAEATSWQPDVDSLIQAQFSINESPIFIMGHVSPFRNAPKFTLSINVQGLGLKFLEPVLAEQEIDRLRARLTGIFEVSGEVDSLQDTITLTTEAELVMENVFFAMESIVLEQRGLSLEGITTLSGALSAPDVRFEGLAQFVESDLHFQFDQYRIEHKLIGWDGTVDLKQGETPTLKLLGVLDAKGFNFSDKENPVLAIAAESYGVHDTDISMDLNTSVIQGTHTIQFKQADLTLNYLGTGAIDTSAEWNGNIHFWDTVETTLDMDTTIQLSGLSIKEEDAESTHITFDSLTVTSDQFHLHASPSENTLVLNGALEISESIIVPVDSPYTITQDYIQWQGSLQSNEAGDMRIDGDVHAQATTVTEGANGRLVSDVESITLTELLYEGTDAIKIGQVEVENVALLERKSIEAAPEDASEYLATIKHIELKGMTLNDNTFGADTIVLDSVNTWMERDEEGNLELTTWFPAEEVTETEASETEASEIPVVAEAETEAMNIRIGSFVIDGENKVVFRDTSVDPSVRLDLEEVAFSIGNLDTRTPETLSPFQLSAKLGKYSEISTQGTLAPLAEKLSADLTTSIKQVDLSPLTPYSERFIGYRLKSGVFNGDFDIAINKGELDTKNEFLVNQLAMERLSAEEKDRFAEQVGYSVNTALSLLRDKNGDIQLSVPVSGSMDDPSISIGDIIQKAMFNAVKGSVLVVFKPLGAIFDQSNFLKFEPIEFEVGSAELPDDVQKKLKAVSKLLDNKPGIRLSLCGVTTTADVNFMIEKKKAELPKPEPVEPVVVEVESDFLRDATAPSEDAEPEAVTEEETIELAEEEILKLSQARGEAVKDFLVKEGGVDPERLILCSPGVDKDEKAKPRVDFSL